MQNVSQQFLDALRESHQITTTATHRNLITGIVTDLEVADGSVTIDATADVRRTLSLTVPGSQTTWDALDTVGGEITVTQSMVYSDQTTEDVPLGVFVVDQDQIDYGPYGSITLTCPDRWVKVQRNQFGPSNRASVPSNMAWQEIKRLVEACWGGDYPFPGWSQLDESATTKVGSLLWDDGDRAGAITQIAQDSALEVFFDAAGMAVLRPIPTLTNTSPSVWAVDAGGDGVMLSASRSRDRSAVRNVIIVSTSATDVTFTPQEVSDTDVTDPLATSGPLGYVPMEYTSPTLRNSAQARAAGRAQLAKTLGVAKQLSLESVGNFALDAEDVIQVLLPLTDIASPPTYELHILDTVVTPLIPTGTQQLTTRSTVKAIS